MNFGDTPPKVRRVLSRYPYFPKITLGLIWALWVGVSGILGALLGVGGKGTPYAYVSGTLPAQNSQSIYRFLGLPRSPEHSPLPATPQSCNCTLPAQPHLIEACSNFTSPCTSLLD